MKTIKYKFILVIWLALGIAISGYFYIFPTRYRDLPNSKMDRSYEEDFGPQYKDGKESEVAILVTLVGIVVIGGLGQVLEKNKF